MAPGQTMAFPAPSLRELSSECETEGVSSDGSTRPMVTRKPLLALEIFPVTFIGVHSLSQPFGLPAPSEREPGLAVPFIVPPKNRNVAGDFHRPYETQRF